jgi:uncharacterized protein YjbI with pentapeptide repeats
MVETDLRSSDLSDSFLAGATAERAKLQGTIFSGAHIEAAKFIDCEVDDETDFTDVSADRGSKFVGTQVYRTKGGLALSKYHQNR